MSGERHHCAREAEAEAEAEAVGKQCYGKPGRGSDQDVGQSAAPGSLRGQLEPWVMGCGRRNPCVFRVRAEGLES